jgi:hypothetical protein
VSTEGRCVRHIDDNKIDDNKKAYGSFEGEGRLGERVNHQGGTGSSTSARAFAADLLQMQQISNHLTI